MMRTVIIAGVATALLGALGGCGGGEDDLPEATPTPVRSMPGLPLELIGPWQVAEGEGSYAFAVDGTWSWDEPGCQAGGGYKAAERKLTLTVTREGCGREAGEYGWAVANAKLTLTRPDGQDEVYIRPEGDT
ncbi:hypothetical protein [Actinocorallia sp. A-T 12471]|uniref:hypothetical protein n=1 Tax=Actinocorallia sp. A-T 12471 TaxID=3089813 RepID=UPI0029CB6A8B|nr:hypothetical protein [Actinocorallia sp. A-T 12471]MDX6738894.1 hypothetical protein [Actinocorallia sp. A-T 12471]